MSKLSHPLSVVAAKLAVKNAKRIGSRLLIALGLLSILAFATTAQAQSILSSGEVGQVIGRAVAEAQARNTPATIAVVDRSGNVLGVYQMNGANPQVTVSSGRGIPAGNGLEMAVVPSSLAAISKAVTGNYLSSGGNSFSTRVASQIVQEHFNPCLLYTSPSPRDLSTSRMPSSA